MRAYEQKYLKKPGLLVLVTVLGMVAPFSTDAYLPALPTIAEEFCITDAAMNLTLVLFNLFMAIGIVFFGPISDKLGRKKPLVMSIVMFGVGSLGCAFSANITTLIIFRIIQAFGAGGMSTTSIAIVKDSFDGKTRGFTLSAVQSFFIVAPVVAPLLGAWIVTVATWNMIFIALVIFAMILSSLALLYQESIPLDEVYTGSVVSSYKKIFQVGAEINFTPFLISVSFFFAPFMAYLGTSSYVYEGMFGLNASEFSFFFALNALTSLAGPLLSMLVNGRGHKKLLVTLSIVVGIIINVCLFMFGHMGPWGFVLCIIPYCIVNSFLRPFATDILLDQHDGDTGSASSWLNFVYSIVGALGMQIGSINLFNDHIISLVLTMSLCLLIATVMWIYVRISKKIHMKNFD